MLHLLPSREAATLRNQLHSSSCCVQLLSQLSFTRRPFSNPSHKASTSHTSQMPLSLDHGVDRGTGTPPHGMPPLRTGCAPCCMPYSGGQLGYDAGCSSKQPHLQVLLTLQTTITSTWPNAQMPQMQSSVLQNTLLVPQRGQTSSILATKCTRVHCATSCVN